MEVGNLDKLSIKDTDSRVSGRNNEWLISIMKEEEQTRSSITQFPKIPRVPSTLRKWNVKSYDPLVVSIGPYHHGRPNLKHVESLKAGMVRQFVRRCNAPIEALFRGVAEVVDLARSCYEEHVTGPYSDMKFTQMMFLDGCFVLEFIFCFMCSFENLKMGRDVAVLARRDLFLLENQLPFEILDSLLSSRFERGEGMELIDSFVKLNRFLPAEQLSWKEIIVSLSGRCFPRAPMSKEKKPEIEDHQPVRHLLELLHNQLIDKNAVYGSARDIGPIYMYQWVQELKAMGIHFRPSRTDRLTDVMFESSILYPTLRLPPITVDYSTKSTLLNLAAYETCSNASNFEVTSYVVFMISLIGHTDDVGELKSKEVVINLLGDDEAVAELFGSMVTAGMTPSPLIYSHVRAKIEDYLGNWRKFIAVWAVKPRKLYFKSTLAVIYAIVSAFVILVLTLLQTIFSILQEKQ